MYLNVWCVFLLATNRGLGTEGNKEWLILLRLTWPLSGGAVPRKGWSVIQNSKACLLLLAYTDQYQIGRSVTSRETAQPIRETLSSRDTPLVCISYHLKDQQSLRSLICVFSLSGSLSWPHWSALIKSGFSISVATCSMRSKAPGWQSRLLSAIQPPTTNTTCEGRRKLFCM